MAWPLEPWPLSAAPDDRALLRRVLDPMAVKPVCVICGAEPREHATAYVAFADYLRHRPRPEPACGEPAGGVGATNELGVAAPPGVGVFCARHRRAARRLRAMSASEAVGVLRAKRDRRRAMWAKLETKLQLPPRASTSGGIERR